MKILVTTQYWEPEVGVPQRRWAWLTELLMQNGHEVYVIVPHPHNSARITYKDWIKDRKWRGAKEWSIGKHGEYILRSGFIPSGDSILVKTLNQSYAALAGLQLALKLPKLSGRAVRPDLIIGTVPALPTAALTFITAKSMKLPYVIDLRDAWPDLLFYWNRWNEEFRSERPAVIRYFTRLAVQPVLGATTRTLDHIFRHSAGLITTSSWLEAFLKDKWEKDGPDSRAVKTVRNVFHESAIRESDRNQKRANNLNVIYAGTIGRAQNLGNVAEALRKLKESDCTVNVRIIGDGAMKNAFLKRCQELGVKIEYFNKVTPADLGRHYSWADTALVHLADWDPLKRTIPSKTFELMSLGIHITAVAEGETAELIKSLGAGECVQTNNPLNLAKLWEKMAKRAKLNVDLERIDNWLYDERNQVAKSNILAVIDNALEAQCSAR